jgi:acetyl esterase/lipase
MKRMLVGVLLASSFFVGIPVAARAADEPSYTRKEDVIYGRKFGTALTMDVFAPKKDANGIGLIFCVSGGWFSSHEGINAGFANEFLKRGYTVFAVVHGSQPKFSVPEILEDMHRAVRFIRYHAKDYKVDPDRLGIYGGSAGGHLSLMQGTAGTKGNPEAKDPVERVSSRVQAVACFFPPTDFLNWEREGYKATITLPDGTKTTAQVSGKVTYQLDGRTVVNPFRPALTFHEFDKVTHIPTKITDEKKITEICRQISPITHVSKETAPTLIIHGDKDTLVPIQQAKVMIEKLKTAKVPNKLIIREGAGHGGPAFSNDLALFADWFDEYLRNQKKETPK